MDIKTLKAKRASIRGRLTKFENYLNQSETVPISEYKESQVNELKLKVDMIRDLFKNFTVLQDQIDELSLETITIEIDERDATDSKFIELIAEAETILRQCATESQQLLPHHHSQSEHLHSVNFKLPKIEIAKFDGTYSKWLDFRDTFKSLIHENSRLLPIYKFHYLHSYLTGEAANILTNLAVSDKNYTVAWDLLCQRYNNKRHLITQHIDSILFELQPTHRDSDGSLRALVYSVNKNLRALSSLGQSTDEWDPLIVQIMYHKLDFTTKRAWDENRNPADDTMPKLSELMKFLQNRANIVENTSSSKKNFSNNKQERACKSLACIEANTNNIQNRESICWVCNYCAADHSIYKCPSFLSKTPEQRKTEIYRLKLCPNCLKKGHVVKDCPQGPCRKCNRKHNSLLHNTSQSATSISVQPAIDEATPESATDIPDSTIEVPVNFSSQVQRNNHVILSTAVINVENPTSNTLSGMRVRCLLDSGSAATFITRRLKDKLGLPAIPTKTMKITGMGNTHCGLIAERSIVRIHSLHTDYNTTLSCPVLPELTANIPSSTIDLKYFKIPPKTPLADPSFNTSGPIDMLIGADLFWEIIGREQQTLGASLPFLRSSQLGWLISGPISIPSNCVPRNIQCNLSRNDDHSNNNLDQQLARFWELEEIPKKPLLSDSEKICEQHFNKHTTRQENGRFSVKLPLKESTDVLGDSYHKARQRLFSLERKFRKNPNLKQAYCEFIAEYLSLGHCTPLEQPPPPHRRHYLCHHAVLREQSESTKLRVVFDGSAATSTGVSINDLQMIGPKVQDSLFSILLRFRLHKYVLAGDIDKFFRQVDVHEEDRDLQLILWRDEDNLPIRILKLNTVTYGFASASYLSTKCLWQLGEDCEDDKVKETIQKDFYCDDLLTGADTKEELLHILNAVTAMLKSGCFNLRKFRSNAPDIFPVSSVDLQSKLSLSDASSALGLGWSPPSDSLQFTIEATSLESTEKITKRAILSSSFSIFDPLGLLSPSTVQPKMLMQQLWRRGLDWDEPVPEDLRKEWQKMSSSLPSLNEMAIPRRVLCKNPQEIQLHFFCDASMHAYGACIYLRSMDNEGNVAVHLLCAKSRVAPTKPPLTIPKLELLGALLAANLTKTVLDSLRCPISTCIHWCDSSVVLAWLNSTPSKLKSFVANKVVEICENTNLSSWRHVPTAANPADYISRGVPAEKLRTLQDWWSGPYFLSMEENHWPSQEKFNKTNLPEMKVLFVTTTSKSPVIRFEDFSSLNKIKRTFAYVLRYVQNLKDKSITRGPLSVQEMNTSLILLAKEAQKQSFPEEYNKLLKGESILKGKISALNPFLDEEGVMRVGGRLDRSGYSHDKKHPIILDSKHHMTNLIFRQEHLRLLHAGPQQLLYTIRESFWPTNGRHLSRSTVRSCVVCRRHKGQTLTPMMGNLPPERVTPAPPFQSIGMDFAGPFHILNKKGRGARVSKCYLCLFICFRFKCVHLEAVSDLSKDAFISCLKRFISRRGKPYEIFSDNGRNFVAASKEVGQFLKSNVKGISDLAANMQINFNFHPPYAPHFSGLSEAGIKSAKHIIKRVMGNTNLTFEELSTLFAQVEAIMNSRPLSPLSSSPSDFLPLSPGHFLIGRPLTAPPSPIINDIARCRTRYDAIEKMRQQFWTRWQREYISELQSRSKWRENKAKLSTGDLVLIQEDNTPPLCWRLGRIAKLYPGEDGISRVADISTTRGTIKRSLTRLCPLLD